MIFVWRWFTILGARFLLLLFDPSRSSNGHHLHDHDRSSTELTAKSTAKASPAKYEQDNNFRAAVLHVVADAFVSVLTIVAIAIAGTVPGAWFLNPLVGMLGAGVILSWSYQLITDTMCALLDLCPDTELNTRLREVLEADGVSQVTDLHVWKLGPGKLGVIASVLTGVESNRREYYASKLAKYKALAHITVEVLRGNLPTSPHRPGTTQQVFQIEDAENEDSCHDEGHDHSHSHAHGHCTKKVGSTAYAALR
jgi:Co/Zn/Cd efflux system component